MVTSAAAKAISPTDAPKRTIGRLLQLVGAALWDGISFPAGAGTASTGVLFWGIPFVAIAGAISGAIGIENR
jgi:hypothetical protein